METRISNLLLVEDEFPLASHRQPVDLLAMDDLQLTIPLQQQVRPNLPWLFYACRQSAIDRRRGNVRCSLRDVFGGFLRLFRIINGNHGAQLSTHYYGPNDTIAIFTVRTIDISLPEIYAANVLRLSLSIKLIARQPALIPHA